MSRPAAEFFDKFSDKFDGLYDKRRRTFLMRWLDARFRSDILIRFAMTFEAFGDLKGKTVLDIGCGSGPYVQECLERGARAVTGLDPAPGMLALTRKRLDETVEKSRCVLIEGSFPGVTLPEHDHVIVQGVLDYVADPLAFLKAMRPLVGVSAAVSFPSTHWFRTPFRKIRYTLRRCPVYFYTSGQIESLAREAGYKHWEIRKIAGAGMDFHVVLSKR